MQSSVVVYDEVAHYEGPEGTISVSTIPLIATSLIGYGAQQLIVPQMEDHSRFSSEIDTLPNVFRRRIKLVDKHQSALKRVERYLEPLREDTEENPDSEEAFFVRSLVPVLYQILLAEKFQSAATETRLQSVIHSAHDLNFHVFGDESRVRLAQIGSVLFDYQPQNLSSTLIRIPTRIQDYVESLDNILTSEEFSFIAGNTYGLGFLTNPAAALRKLRQSVKRLAGSKLFAPIASMAKIGAAITATPGASETISAIGGFASPPGRTGPPIWMATGSANLRYKTLLDSLGPGVKPRVGKVEHMHIHTPSICGSIHLGDNPIQNLEPIELNIAGVRSCFGHAESHFQQASLR